MILRMATTVCRFRLPKRSSKRCAKDEEYCPKPSKLFIEVSCEVLVNGNSLFLPFSNICMRIFSQFENCGWVAPSVAGTHGAKIINVLEKLQDN